MTRLRLAIPALAGITALLCGFEQVEAQVYFSGGFARPHYVGGFYSAPYSSAYSGYANAYGSGYQSYSVQNYGYGYNPGYYGIGAPGYGSAYGLAAPVIVNPNPAYGTSTTIIRGGPTGGVVQYSNNGNGYTYVPDSNYPTLIQQQPTLGLSRTYVPQSPPPVIRTIGGTIKLVCPRTAGGPLTYSLNGHVYTIQPGYSQTFRDDRVWNLEFRRGGEGSEIARHTLKAGTYNFAVGTNGWELQQPGEAVIGDLPAAPLPELSPSPNPSTPPPAIPPTSVPSLPPSPIPPP